MCSILLEPSDRSRGREQSVDGDPGLDRAVRSRCGSCGFRRQPTAVRATVPPMYGSPFDDYPYYDRPRQKHPDREDRLRHVIYLDGRLIDTWTEPVEATAYHSWAIELDAASLPTPEPEPACPAPHEAVLNWLDGVVGGRTALVALDGSPLEG